MTPLKVDPADLHVSSTNVAASAETLQTQLRQTTTEDASTGFLPHSKAAHPGFVHALISDDTTTHADLESLSENLKQAAWTYETQVSRVK